MRANRGLDVAERARARRAGAVVGAGLFAALASISCCILPLVLFGLGIGGAWIANLTALEPYQPVFIVASVALLFAGWRLASHPSADCTDGACAIVPRRLIRIALWTAGTLVVGAVAFPYLAPALLAT